MRAKGYSLGQQTGSAQCTEMLLLVILISIGCHSNKALSPCQGGWHQDATRLVRVLVNTGAHSHLFRPDLAKTTGLLTATMLGTNLVRPHLG